jgi:transcriptional regulator with XRE-family HTH domain/energy-coupling factor transporter ATP-binding protein EcfA2
MSTNPLADLFESKRKQLGWNYRTLAEKSGQDYRLVLRTLKGQTIPYEFTGSMLAEALDIPEDLWKPLLLRSKADRVESKVPEVARYLERFLEDHRYIRPAGMAQTNKDVRVELKEVFICLSAQRDSIRIQLECEKYDPENQGDKAAPEPQRRRASPDIAGGESEKRLKGPVRESPASRIVALSEVIREEPVCVLLGHPGSGKTTTLKHIGVVHADAHLKGETTASDPEGSYGAPRIPIYIRASEYASGAMEVSLFEYALASTELEDIEALRNSRSQLILLDGLDEVDTSDLDLLNQRINALVADCRQQGASLCITSRIHGYERYRISGVQEFAVCEMDAEQVKRFFHAWCVAIEHAIGTPRYESIGQRRAEAILNAIEGSEGVRALAVNPLLCVLIALIQQANVVLPERRVVLMQKAVEATAGRHRFRTRRLHHHFSRRRGICAAPAGIPHASPLPFWIN